MKKEKPWTDKVLELSTEQVECFRDAFPVTGGHLLFVPVEDTRENVSKAFTLAQIVGDHMVVRGACTGYNIGINKGESAGQTINWPHVHLIPRCDGDTKNPVGGVRGVIPDRQNYKTSKHYKNNRKNK